MTLNTVLCLIKCKNSTVVQRCLSIQNSLLILIRELKREKWKLTLFSESKMHRNTRIGGMSKNSFPDTSNNVRSDRVTYFRIILNV